MFSVPPETAAGAAAPPDALVAGLMVPLHAVTANPTVQRVATAVSRLVLRDIEYSFGWSLWCAGSASCRPIILANSVLGNVSIRTYHFEEKGHRMTDARPWQRIANRLVSSQG